MQFLLLVTTYRFASNLLSSGKDADGLVYVQDAVSVKVHGVQEGLQHVVGDGDAMLATVVALLLEIVRKLSQAFHVDAALVKHGLHDLLFSTKEVLEGAVLLDVADAHLVILVFVEVKKVIWDLVEWNVVNIQTLCNVERRDVVLHIDVELVKLEVPQGLDQFVSEIHILLKGDLVLVLEDPLAHSDVDFSEIAFLADCLELLGEVRLGLMPADGLRQFSKRHLAAGLVKVLDDALVWGLSHEDEEVELSKGNLSISVDVGDPHDFVYLRSKFFKVSRVIFRLLVVVWGQGLEEVLV